MFGLKLFSFTESGEDMLVEVPSDVTKWLILLFLGVGVVGYLLGTLNFAIIISKKSFNEDIREFGSGNAGMTNMMRTYGRKTGIITFVLDLLKAVLAVVIGWFLLGEAGGFFSYPTDRRDERSRVILRQAGVFASVGGDAPAAVLIRGLPQSLYEMPRQFVGNDLSGSELTALLDAAIS